MRYMNAIYEQPSLWQRVRPMFIGFDGPLLIACCCCRLGLVTMYSAGFDHGTRFVDHGRNMLIALAMHVGGGAGPAAALDGAGGADLHWWAWRC